MDIEIEYSGRFPNYCASIRVKGEPTHDVYLFALTKKGCRKLVVRELEKMLCR